MIYCKYIAIAVAVLAAVPSSSRAQALNPTGAQTFFAAIDPTIQKWYRPQQLYAEYKWDWWQYSNYARVPYQRYVDTELEGTRWYDLYGNYVTEGWQIYRWTQEQPTTFGSDILKSSRFNSWFNRLVVTQVQRGQYYFAVTVGDEIRTALTPFTFSKPAFNGVQVDLQSDKYAGTLLMSRVNLPIALEGGEVNESKITDFNNLLGFRTTVQIGDFVQNGRHVRQCPSGADLAGFESGRDPRGELDDRTESRRHPPSANPHQRRFAGRTARGEPSSFLSASLPMRTPSPSILSP